MPRVLLLMTTRTYRAGSFLAAAERLGVEVTVGSERAQVLADANPAGHLVLDFRNPAEAADQVAGFARTHSLDAILAADDDGVILAAHASAALGLPHNSVDSVEAARDKHRMREILAAAGIRSPGFRRFDASMAPSVASREVSYPCVLKPLSLSASRGVIRADDPAAFRAAFERVTKILCAEGKAGGGPGSSEEILVEDFIPGVEVALEGILTGGELRVLAIYDKPVPLDGPFFEETIYVTPSRLPSGSREAVVACTREVVATLGLTHGPVHAEARINDAGAWILEIASRSIGGRCSRTLRFGPGISLEELVLRHALGMEGAAWEREARAAGVMMIPIPRAGILEGVEGREAAVRVPGIEEVEISIPVGQKVVPPPEGSRYLGFIFAREETAGAVEAALREAHRKLGFRIAPMQDRPGRHTM